jgi:outer membrane protein, heavy metal efflux system
MSSIGSVFNVVIAIMLCGFAPPRLFCSVGTAETVGRQSSQAVKQTGNAAGQANSVTANDLVQRALQSNGELKAARLDLDRARAKLRQASLRPNPTLDVQQASGRLAGSEDERDLSTAVALPVELGGKRQRRIDVAEAELAATEAEIADRERGLIQQVLSAYADALAAARELEITNSVQVLDDQTVHVVRTRVEQQDASRLELNLLLTEVARLRSQRALAEGRLNAALGTLQTLLGASPTESLSLGDPEAALTSVPTTSPATLDAAIAAALQTRPDLKLARLNEIAAEAGLRLSGAEGKPDLTVSAGFTTSRQFLSPDNAPIPILDRDRALTLGVSIPLPFFNRNQGAISEAKTAIQQARLRREFLEQSVRTEVASAYQRLRAAQSAVDIFRQNVMSQSSDNLRVIRAAYQLGEFKITDVITQQRQFLDTEREYAGALAEQYRAAAGLQAAMGGGRP